MVTLKIKKTCEWTDRQVRAVCLWDEASGWIGTACTPVAVPSAGRPVCPQAMQPCPFLHLPETASVSHDSSGYWRETHDLRETGTDNSTPGGPAVAVVYTPLWAGTNLPLSLTDQLKDRGRCPSWKSPTAGNLSHSPEWSTEIYSHTEL